jgi:hypothetical protein
MQVFVRICVRVYVRVPPAAHEIPEPLKILGISMEYHSLYTSQSNTI